MSEEKTMVMASDLIKKCYNNMISNGKIAAKIRDSVDKEEPLWFLAGIMVDNAIQMSVVLNVIYTQMTGQTSVPPEEKTEKNEKENESEAMSFMKSLLAEEKSGDNKKPDTDQQDNKTIDGKVETTSEKKEVT